MKEQDIFKIVISKQKMTNINNDIWYCGTIKNHCGKTLLQDKSNKKI